MKIDHTLSREEIEKVAVVVLRGENAYSHTPVEGFPKNCLYMIVSPGETIDFLSEEDMGQLGWVRK